MAVKMRCTVRFYGALSSVSIFGLPIFITSSVSRGSGMLFFSLFPSDNEVKFSGENKLDEIVKNQLLWSSRIGVSYVNRSDKDSVYQSAEAVLAVHLHQISEAPLILSATWKKEFMNGYRL
ncbi:unnamed protein product [Brassica oleracea]